MLQADPLSATPEYPADLILCVSRRSCCKGEFLHLSVVARIGYLMPQPPVLQKFKQTEGVAGLLTIL